MSRDPYRGLSLPERLANTTGAVSAVDDGLGSYAVFDDLGRTLAFACSHNPFCATRERCVDLIRNSTVQGIPSHMVEAITTWIERGLPHPADMGQFFRRVLQHDLTAVLYADEANRAAIVEWMRFLHNEAPAHCHGSVAALQAWHERGGLRGRAA